MKTVNSSLILIISFAVICIVTLFFATVSNSEMCFNSENPSCSNYANCMEATCPCGASGYDYATTYGNKYCTKFLENDKWSNSGKVWRDRTLQCLQEEMVKSLPINSAECDCEKLQTKAYESHVQCYAEPFGNSSQGICFLPSSDIKNIRSIIDIGDLTDSLGLRAIFEIAKKCESINPGSNWDIIVAFLTP